MERREKLHKNATKCNGYTLEGSCGNRVVGERQKSRNKKLSQRKVARENQIEFQPSRDFSLKVNDWSFLNNWYSPIHSKSNHIQGQDSPIYSRKNLLKCNAYARQNGMEMHELGKVHASRFLSYGSNDIWLVMLSMLFHHVQNVTNVHSLQLSARLANWAWIGPIQKPEIMYFGYLFEKQSLTFDSINKLCFCFN